MNGNTHEITWKQGSMEHACWASDEEDSRFVCEALKLHPSVESVRVVALVMKWDRPEKVMRTSSPVGTVAIMPISRGNNREDVWRNET